MTGLFGKKLRVNPKDWWCFSELEIIALTMCVPTTLNYNKLIQELQNNKDECKPEDASIK